MPVHTLNAARESKAVGLVLTSAQDKASERASERASWARRRAEQRSAAQRRETAQVTGNSALLRARVSQPES